MEQKSSPNGWKVLTPQMLRLMPRGTSGSFLDVTFDSSRPVPDAGREKKVRQELGRHLAAALSKDPPIAQFLALRDNLRAVEYDRTLNEAEQLRLEAKHKRLLLEPYSPAPAARQAQIDAERRRASSAGAPIGGVACELEKELEAARTCVAVRPDFAGQLWPTAAISKE